MTTDRNPALEARLETLERELAQCRRESARSRKTLLALLLLGIAGIGIAAARPSAVPDVIAAHRLEILDDDGNPRLVADVDERGGLLNLWSAGGANVARLSVNDSGGDLNIWSAGGETVLGAYASEQGAELSIWNTEQSRVVRCATSGEGGVVEVADALGRVSIAALGAPGGGSLSINAPAGPAVSASAGADGGSMIVHNSRGTPVVSALSDARGSGRLTTSAQGGEETFVVENDAMVGGSVGVSDNSGARRVSLTADRRGGAVTCFNESGQPAMSTGAAEPDGSGFLDLANAGGVRVFSAATNAEGCGRLDVATETGQFVFTVNGVSGRGAAMALLNASGRKGLLAGTGEDGGLLNLYNARQVPVFVAGYGEGSLGGALSIRNGRGVAVMHAGTDDEGDGAVVVYDREGEKPRAVNAWR